MRRIVAFAFALFAALLSAGSDPAALEWKNPSGGEFLTRDGRRYFRLAIPEAGKTGQHCAEARIDIARLRGQLVRFSIKVSGQEVSEPPHAWNGVKFMVNYTHSGGAQLWSGSNRLSGTFPEQEVSFAVSVNGDAENGRVMIGLQDSSGAVEFDLDSLRVEPLFANAPETGRKIGYPESVRNTPALRGVMSPKRFKPEDFPVLKEWNVNLVRFQISRNWHKADSDRDLAEYDRWIDDTLDHLDRVFEEGRKYGLRFVIDLHQPPGGRLPNRELAMHYEEKYAAHFVKTWEKIAARFKGNPAVWAYDLINEPEQRRKTKYDYLTIQRMAAGAVRKIDPDTPIMVEANQAAAPAAFHYLVPLEMDNVIYQVHMYLPGEYTHQNVFPERGKTPPFAYPGIISGKRWNRDAIREALAPVRAFQLRHNARIYVGEFSAVAWAPGAAQYLEDCIAVFEEYGWDWTYHAFREWQGWSLEYEGEDRNSFRPSRDNDRKRVLLKGFEKNR